MGVHLYFNLQSV